MKEVFMQNKSMDWFIYDKDLHHEKVKYKKIRKKAPVKDKWNQFLQLSNWFFVCMGNNKIARTEIPVKG